MPSATPKITSRGRWQPKSKASAPPPPPLRDLKDEQAPVRAGRIRPYLWTGAACLPLLAGLWIWFELPATPVVPVASSPTSAPSHPTGPTIQSVRVVPDGEAGALTLRAEGDASGRLPDGTRLQWYANETPLPRQTAAVLPAGMVKRGDRVLVEVTSNFGTLEASVLRSPVFVFGNVAPVVLKATIEPSDPRVEDRLRVLVEVTDVDQDEVSLSIRWSKNGTLVQDGPSHSLDVEGIVRGDHVVVEVVPTDGHVDGAAVKSGEVIIGNSVPRITSTPKFAAEGNQLLYVIVAEDPDHDPVRYRLAAGPSDMKVDPSTGRVVWLPTAGVQGPQRVRVEALDNHDGVAAQEFDVTVPPSPAS